MVGNSSASPGLATLARILARVLEDAVEGRDTSPGIFLPAIMLMNELNGLHGWANPLVHLRASRRGVGAKPVERWYL